MNILVFPCGSEIGIEIHRSLSNNKNFKLFGLSSSDDAGRFLFSNYSKIKSDVRTPDNLIDEIKFWVEEWKIDFIYPTMDSIISLLNHVKYDIKIPFASQTEFFEIFADKLNTYNFFSEYTFIPRYNDLLIPEKDRDVFVKPRIGYGSRGTRIGKFEEIRDLDTYVYCELLTGKEITVDSFSVRGDLIWSAPRIRKRTKFGISVETEYLRLSEVDQVMRLISNKLFISGAWFAQFKEDVNGEFKLLEIAPRFGGSSGLSRVYGMSFAEASIYLHLGEIEVLKNQFDRYPPLLVRQLDTKFLVKDSYDKIFVDFDDTLVQEDSILNVSLFAWLLRQNQRGKRLIIITRHKGSLHKKLRDLRVAHFFDEIIWLKNAEKKSIYISEYSVFIDDSFAERLEVSCLENVLVLDPQTVIDIEFYE